MKKNNWTEKINSASVVKCIVILKAFKSGEALYFKQRFNWKSKWYYILSYYILSLITLTEKERTKAIYASY